MNTSETAEDSLEKTPAGWRETYVYLMGHFKAPCLGSNDAALRYLHEIERLIDQAVVAVDAQGADAAEAQEILRMWNIEAKQYVRLLVLMLEIHVRELQTTHPGAGKDCEKEIARLKRKFGV